MRDFSRFNLPNREHSKSFSAYDLGGDKDIGHNRRATVNNERAEALAIAKKLHDEEKRRKQNEEMQKSAEIKKSNIDELKRKAAEAKLMQASGTLEKKQPEQSIDSIEQDKKVGQSENTIATEEELKVQLENAKKANESAAAKSLGTDAKPEEIITAALNDIF